MKNLFSILALLITTFQAQAQDEEYELPTQKVGFVSLLETTDHTLAVKVAKEFADSLDVQFESILLVDETEGLVDTATCGCGEQHGYIGRGRFDAGNYVSIELASWYNYEKAHNIYLVIVLSHPITDELLGTRIKNIMEKYPEAVYFEDDVYTGCMH
jgi:hypothetical protein